MSSPADEEELPQGKIILSNNLASNDHIPVAQILQVVDEEDIHVPQRTIIAPASSIRPTRTQVIPVGTAEEEPHKNSSNNDNSNIGSSFAPCSRCALATYLLVFLAVVAGGVTAVILLSDGNKTSKPHTTTDPDSTNNHEKGHRCFTQNVELRRAIQIYAGTSKVKEAVAVREEIWNTYGRTINDWCLSNMTDLSNAFESLTSFNEPIDKWDVSAAFDMSFMFWGVDSFNQPLNSWDVSAATNMESMFSYTLSFNQPLDSWNVSSVNTMASMFGDAASFNQNLAAWDTSRVRHLPYMFSGANSFNQDISMWDVSNVDSFAGVFFGASSFTQDLCKWGSQVTRGVSFLDTFQSTKCPFVSVTPDLDLDPPGPFCHSCAPSSSPTDPPGPSCQACAPMVSQMQTVTNDFGAGTRAIATVLSGDGSTMASMWNNNVGDSQVTVYRFVPQIKVWERLGESLTSDEQEGLAFGRSLALSADGSSIAVGDTWSNANGFASGATRVYSINAALQWEQVGQTLVGTAPNEQFGETVALSADGLTLATSTSFYGETEPISYGAEALGQLRIFQLNKNPIPRGVPLGQALPGETKGDSYGFSMDLSADGYTLLVAAPYHNYPSSSAGFVRAFTYNSNTKHWEMLGQIMRGEYSDALLGRRATLSGDGSTMAVSLGSGSVLVYKYSSESSQWKPAPQLELNDTNVLSITALDLSDDGLVLAVGILRESSSGYLRVFRYVSDVDELNPIGHSMHSYGSALGLSAMGEV